MFIFSPVRCRFWREIQTYANPTLCSFWILFSGFYYGSFWVLFFLASEFFFYCCCSVLGFLKDKKAMTGPLNVTMTSSKVVTIKVDLTSSTLDEASPTSTIVTKVNPPDSLVALNGILSYSILKLVHQLQTTIIIISQKIPSPLDFQVGCCHLLYETYSHHVMAEEQPATAYYRQYSVQDSICLGLLNRSKEADLHAFVKKWGFDHCETDNQNQCKVNQSQSECCKQNKLDCGLANVSIVI